MNARGLMRSLTIDAGGPARLAPAVRRVHAAFGVNPVDLYSWLYRGRFGTAFSWQNTLTGRPADPDRPVLALPARLGPHRYRRGRRLVLGGLAAVAAGLGVEDSSALRPRGSGRHAPGRRCVGGADRPGGRAEHSARRQRDDLQPAAVLHRHRVFNYLVEGPMRDPASLNKPSTYPIAGRATASGQIPGLDVHWGLVYRRGLLAVGLCADGSHDLRLRRPRWREATSGPPAPPGCPSAG